MEDGVYLRQFLRAKQHFLNNQEEIWQTFLTGLVNVFGGIINELPAIPSSESLPTKPLILLFHDPHDIVDRIIGTLTDDELEKSGLFRTVATILNANVYEASGIPFGTQSKKPLITAARSTLKPLELVHTYLADTPLLDLLLTPVPFEIPEYISIEQNRLPFDPDHPKHHCYQCRRPLPPDFAEEHWQELSYPLGPFFHTEHCKITAANRHQHDGASPEDAYRSLVKEYELAVRTYEDKKQDKDEADNQKQQEREAEELRKAQEAQERREERDRQAWLRDQERAETKWEREQEQLRKDQEAEEERVAAEQAEAQQQTTNRSVYERLDDTTRCEHTQIVAGSGAGKTTLIEYDILKLLSRPNPPGIVVIDPKGLLIQRLQKLALFHPDNGRLRDRLIIVDPAHSPALNMFDTSGFRVNENQTIDIFQYMFASKINALTPKQGTMFAFVVRLLLSMKTATIHDLLDLCDDKSPSVEQSAFRPYIENLDRTSQRFFTNEYFGEKSEYASTKKKSNSAYTACSDFPN